MLRSDIESLNQSHSVVGQRLPSQSPRSYRIPSAPELECRYEQREAARNQGCIIHCYGSDWY